MDTTENNLSLDKLDCMQDILERPTRPAGHDLRPDFFRNGVVRTQQTPVRARLGLDPLEVLDLAPAVFVIGTIVIQSLFGMSS